MQKRSSLMFILSAIIFIIGCDLPEKELYKDLNKNSTNVLNYEGSPEFAEDRNSLTFSDLSAWFSYGFPTEPAYFGGFSGPFLMTQENGIWSSPVMSQLEIIDFKTGQMIDLSEFEVQQTSFISHLEQVFKNGKLEVEQTLVYVSPHSSMIITQITNTSNSPIELHPIWKGTFLINGLNLSEEDNGILITSKKSNAVGRIQIFGDTATVVSHTDSSYSILLDHFKIDVGETRQLITNHSFVFPESSLEAEQSIIAQAAEDPYDFIQSRKIEKNAQLIKLYEKLDSTWNDSIYKSIVDKSVLTLQNNWRIPAGELKHHGLFPSYHYKGFHGFWAWDSWKHSAALAHYDTFLAKEQIRAMYDYQSEDGFIPDCIFRDTTIENHNYRDTKPPLSGWAIWKVYEQSQDIDFLKELYPKLIRQHEWWYKYRDHDSDGICEYGSTDGSLIAAKWESGMDNAVRFDHSKILENSDTSFSLDQESVDLNAYLFAEKQYLVRMAKTLNRADEMQRFQNEAIDLKEKIQNQFFDSATGWFYDTSLAGLTFINAMGSEGWIPLWAEVATREQADAVKNNMMNPAYFNTKVPFQTLSAAHPEYEPNGGYWRGPNWLDQSYFGIIGLHNYSYHQEAYRASYKLLHNARGVLDPGSSIRENYNPKTGEGLESENFSWSAASYLLLLIKD